MTRYTADIMESVFPTGVGMNRVPDQTLPYRLVFPTGVGMNRMDTASTGCASVPHRRGDEPKHFVSQSPSCSVPHRRGDEPSNTSGSRMLDVFPTGVGMNRGICCPESTCVSVPHRRGDEPPTDRNGVSSSVPHRRGDEPL